MLVLDVSTSLAASVFGHTKNELLRHMKTVTTTKINETTTHEYFRRLVHTLYE